MERKDARIKLKKWEAEKRESMEKMGIDPKNAASGAPSVSMKERIEMMILTDAARTHLLAEELRFRRWFHVTCGAWMEKLQKYEKDKQIWLTEREALVVMGLEDVGGIVRQFVGLWGWRM